MITAAVGSFLYMLPAFGTIMDQAGPDAAFSRVQDNGVVSAAEMSRLEARFFPIAAGAPARSATLVALFHVDYRSRAYDGSSTTLSGLVALPSGGAPKGLVLYFHATTTERENVPSRANHEGGPIEAEIVLAAFASEGYAVIAPDYLGLGDHVGVHPYALSSVNCDSGLDMIEPARAFAAAKGWPIGRRLFVTGYSEGGAVAMWAAKRLEMNALPGAGPSACAPVSGAYDLSGTEIRSMLSSQSNPKWLGARFFLAGYLGWAVTSLEGQRTEPALRLDDMFVPSFASYVATVFGRDRKDDDVVKDLAAKGFQLGAFRTIKRTLQPALVRAAESHDLRNALVARLAREDCYDWRPTAPLCLICLANDRLVPPDNAKLALEAMRARGADPDLVDEVEVTDRGFDHITFLPRGLAIARAFFNGGFAALDRSKSPEAAHRFSAGDFPRGKRSADFSPQ